MDEMNLVISNKTFKLHFYLKILLLLLSIFLTFSLFYKVSLYDMYDATVVRKDDKYYVQVFSRYDQTNIAYGQYILIDNKKYDYEVISIDNNLYENYMLVNISVDLDKKYKINNNYLSVKQLREKTSLFRLMLNELKKGMNL